MMHLGADAVYCAASLSTIRRMADEKIPVFGHVGLIPHFCTWTGALKRSVKRPKARGRFMSTAAPMKRQALLASRLKLCRPKSLRKSQSIHRSFLSRWGVVRAAIANIFLRAMSSVRIVAICRDTLKKYVDLAKEVDQIQELRIKAFKSFAKDVQKGAYPSAP